MRKEAIVLMVYQALFLIVLLGTTPGSRSETRIKGGFVGVTIASLYLIWRLR